jgi:4-hydroxy-tetrahydrodipicolinate synthase
MNLEGVYTALVTPFDAMGRVDEQALRKLIQRQMDANVDGIVFLGTTGEAATLEDSEREMTIQIAASEAKRKLPLLIGCGSSSTKKTVSLAVQAQNMGADGLLVVTPYYNRPTQEGIFLHFKAVTESVSIPICVYNVPSRTGQNIETDTLCRIAELPNIVGVKDASGNISQMEEIIEKIHHKRPQFAVLSGCDQFTLPLMTLGGHGVISVISNLVPHAVKALVTSTKEGNFTFSRAIHYSLRPLVQAAFLETNPICIKLLLHYAGLCSAVCRLPLCAPSQANAEKILQIFNACDHLITDLEAANQFKKVS